MNQEEDYIPYPGTFSPAGSLLFSFAIICYALWTLLIFYFLDDHWIGIFMFSYGLITLLTIEILNITSPRMGGKHISWLRSHSFLKPFLPITHNGHTIY